MADDFNNAPSLRCHMWARGAVIEPNPSLDKIERWKQRGWIVVGEDGYALASRDHGPKPMLKRIVLSPALINTAAALAPIITGVTVAYFVLSPLLRSVLQ